jgi:tRNA A-37 threonylcarbamoyl transferase component Bud32
MTDLRRLGKYRLVRRLAVGGVAEVYLAVAEGLSGFEKRVVLKRLIPELARDAELLSMFLDEARLMALLHHPHIAEVYDIGAQEGEYFFALEHIDGCDLRDLLDARPGEPLPLAAALTVLVALAEGLDHAHGQRAEDGSLLGVVHRDVTPSNVLCGRQGEVKLVDFGVAKWNAQRTRTEQGTIKGKFAYMSPEQCRAESLDRRSDLFALGVILYELTTGGKPFLGDSEFEVLSAIVAGRVAAPSSRRPDYPASLERVVHKALCTDRAQRFATAGEIGQALVRVAGDLGLQLGPAAVAAEVQACLAAGPSRRTAAAAQAVGPERGRTATDLAMLEPTTAAGPRPPRRRRTIGLAGAALLSVAAIAWAVSSRAPRTPPPAPAPQAKIAEQPADHMSVPIASTAAARVEPIPAPSPAPTRPRGKIRARDRKARPSQHAAQEAAPPREAPKPPVQIWDPDSAILP